MSSIRPQGGWDPMPLAEQAELARQRQLDRPQYAFDPELMRVPQQPFRGSVINDLRAMGGREAGQLTFGTVFGATSGFLMARFLFGLFKVAVVVGFFVFIIFLVGLMKPVRPAPAEPIVRTVTPEPVEESYAHQKQRLLEERDSAARDLSIEVGAIRETLLRDQAVPGSVEMRLNLASLPQGESARCEEKAQRLRLAEGLLANIENRDPQFLQYDPCAILPQ